MPCCFLHTSRILRRCSGGASLAGASDEAKLLYCFPLLKSLERIRKVISTLKFLRVKDATVEQVLENSGGSHDTFSGDGEELRKEWREITTLQ